MELLFSGRMVMFVCALATVSGEMAGAAAVPIETTIEAIHADPKAYAGARILLNATFDECVSLTCRVCDGKETAAGAQADTRCMGVELALAHGATGGVAESHAPTLNEDLVRFTTATLEATYVGPCCGVTPTGELVVGTDRGSELVDVEIVAVLARRPATQGRISMYGKNPLRAAPAEDARSIRAAYDSAVLDDRRKSTSQDFVYLVGPHPERPDKGDGNRGGLCVCVAGTCTSADWPRRLGDATLATPSNPYRCWEAVQRAGVWRFPIR
jgi:hypothetical protein